MCVVWDTGRVLNVFWLTTSVHPSWSDCAGNTTLCVWQPSDVCVCVYVCVCVCVGVGGCMRLCVWVGGWMYVCVSVRTRTWAWVCVCARACVCVCNLPDYLLVIWIARSHCRFPLEVSRRGCSLFWILYSVSSCVFMLEVGALWIFHCHY